MATSEDVAAALVSVAEGGEDAEGAGVYRRCDVLAIATHSRTGIQRWAVGSFAERVLHATALPLLLVRPTAAHDGQAAGAEK